ncbi:transposable element Tcb2 transposase [Trichonephila clavipes]|nr:transposable element Tcb2 transposase [Trichonephila clavipes]
MTQNTGIRYPSIPVLQFLLMTYNEGPEFKPDQMNSQQDSAPNHERCWDQWVREMSCTRIPGSGRPRQTSRQEDRHIVRNSCVQPTASSAAIQAKVAPSLGSPVSSQTIRRRLAEGHLGSSRS